MDVVIIVVLVVVVGLLLRHGGGRRTADKPTVIEARHVRVMDGDSIQIGKSRLRVLGYDAPEWNQPGGNEATRYLRTLVYGDMRVLVVDVDRYGRGLVHLANSRGDVGAQMVAAGHGVAETRRLASPMAAAARRGLGIWGRRGMVTPASWRAGVHDILR